MTQFVMQICSQWFAIRIRGIVDSKMISVSAKIHGYPQISIHGPLVLIMHLHVIGRGWVEYVTLHYVVSTGTGRFTCDCEIFAKIIFADSLQWPVCNYLLCNKKDSSHSNYIWSICACDQMRCASGKCAYDVRRFGQSAHLTKCLFDQSPLHDSNPNTNPRLAKPKISTDLHPTGIALSDFNKRYTVGKVSPNAVQICIHCSLPV